MFVYDQCIVLASSFDAGKAWYQLIDAYRHYDMLYMYDLCYLDSRSGLKLLRMPYRTTDGLFYGLVHLATAADGGRLWRT